MWNEYFPEGLVVGLDLQNNPMEHLPDRVRFYQGSQDDTTLLARIAAECAPDGFDIIIDDASHLGVPTRASFSCLFDKYLKSGGIYVIEDWGTGYWPDWPDGATYKSSPVNSSAGTPSQQTLLSRIHRKLSKLVSPPSSKLLEYALDPDFSGHNFGMVGFVKELVDWVAWKDITSPSHGSGDLPARSFPIAGLAVFNGQVFVHKDQPPADLL